MSFNKEKDLKVNLGGGRNTEEGYINIDICSFPEVDIVHDVSKGIPLPDNSVVEVKARHVLEHIADTIKIMEEIHRVCRDEAIIKIKVPYAKSDGAFKDPTHKSFFTEETFYYFDSGRENRLPDYNIDANFAIKRIAYQWSYSFLRFFPFKKLILKKFLWNIVKTLYIELEVEK